MGLLQAAYRTYQTQAQRVGTVREGEKEPLTPLAHMIANAHIEITLRDDGVFQGAVRIPKAESKTIIPVTVESANRTSTVIKAHPLSDQLRYLAPYGAEKHADYLAQLNRWADSPFSHPKVRAVRRYISGGTIVQDLASAEVILLDEQGLPGGEKIEGAEYDKCLVRWRVIPAPEGVSSACWKDASLFQSFAAFYAQERAAQARDVCMITGEEDSLCERHPKGTLSSSFGAKLISANDSSGFTYRGRFWEPGQAGSVGYTASQMAHSALHWVAANQGVTLGGRTFLCWNPEGAPVPSFALFGLPSGEPLSFSGYRKELLQTLGGYEETLKPEADVVIAALEAATTGRLSVTYYRELSASDFLARIRSWYETCCWDSRRFGVQAPALRRIVDCAFGTERGQFLETDNRILREHIQQLLHCIIDCQPIPLDILHAVTARADTPLAYSPGNRETVLATACALIRKYRNDRNHEKEEWTLALDTSNSNRSYLFGRLLAVAEQVERSTYGREEGREPNAIRMQAEFSRRPLYAWRIIEEKLNPYYARLTPGLRTYYKNMVGEITEKLPGTEEQALNKTLEDIYLLGYYHQRTEMTRKKTVTEGNKDEHSAE